MGNWLELPLPNRWGSQPYPPQGYLDRWARGCTVHRGYPENDLGFRVDQQIASAAQKAGASWVHTGSDGKRWVIYYFNDNLYVEEDDATPASLGLTLTETYVPSFANMGFPAAMSIAVNGANGPVLVRADGSGSCVAVLANLEKPDGNWTATPSASGGSLADGDYLIRIAQIEVDTVTGTIVSGPSAVKTATVSGGGGSGSITVAHATWNPNDRATHWRIGITAVNGTDAPQNYFYSADIVIGTTSSVIQSVPTVTPPFESRNGFYKVTDLTEIVSGKHPRGVCVYEGRFVFWYKDTGTLLWSERDEWGFYSTNTLETGAESSGWNLPVRCVVPMLGHLLVFTEASIHAVHGDLSRDVDGAFPTYAAKAIPQTLETNIGLFGGPEAAKVFHGLCWFMSTSGPAVWTGGRVQLLGEDDIRHERRFWDVSTTTNANERVCIEEDPLTHDILFLVPRKVNSSRAMDGASLAGIPDTIYRWIVRRGVWDVPYQLDLVHIKARTNGAKNSTNYGPVLLMGVNHYGSVVQLNFGRAGGVTDGVVSSSDYDGILASANTTTTATIALAGISADGLIGMTVTLRYPSGDSTYPYVTVQKTIVDNTATSGGNVTITWSGAITVPSTSFWTVRVAGRLTRFEASVDPSRMGVPGATAGSYYRLHALEARFKDQVGAEALS